uniref:Uncharacterized protein n=1 Tax=Clytia hemisphaerica TaxID=252671 RepID=A0A7M6DRW5_9CNID|eukprot:TCONS_00062099-protein
MVKEERQENQTDFTSEDSTMKVFHMYIDDFHELCLSTGKECSSDFWKIENDILLQGKLIIGFDFELSKPLMFITLRCFSKIKINFRVVVEDPGWDYTNWFQKDATLGTKSIDFSRSNNDLSNGETNIFAYGETPVRKQMKNAIKCDSDFLKKFTRKDKLILRFEIAQKLV